MSELSASPLSWYVMVLAHDDDYQDQVGIAEDIIDW